MNSSVNSKSPVGSSLGYGSGSGGPIGISVGIIEESAIAGLSEILGAAVGGNKFLASHAVLRIGVDREM